MVQSPNVPVYTEPRTPRVVELLRKALEWQTLLESGKAGNEADFARREGITRARVTQLMGHFQGHHNVFLSHLLFAQPSPLQDAPRRFCHAVTLGRRRPKVNNYVWCPRNWSSHRCALALHRPPRPCRNWGRSRMSPAEVVGGLPELRLKPPRKTKKHREVAKPIPVPHYCRVLVFPS
jgi:hypothetical protein